MDTKLDFSDVLIQPVFSQVESRKNVVLDMTYGFKYSTKTLSCVPIMAANMDTTGTIGVMKELVKENMFTCLHKFITDEDVLENEDFLKDHIDNFAFTIGYSDDGIERLKRFQEILDFKVICIDIANGYLSGFVDFCRKVREQFPDKIIIAGNVCTEDGVKTLVENGKVDVVKCGIGGGSACTTRIKTGVGFPQFSCAAECSLMAKKLGAKIVSDGGITCPGDLSKAFGVGSDFVMMGGQFAGHKENPGNLIEEDGKRFKEFWGMSSEHAMNKNYGEKKSYRTSEGRHIKIPYKGNIKDTLDDFLGGLRSTCTYTNNYYLEEMIGSVIFLRVNNQYNSSLVK